MGHGVSQIFCVVKPWSRQLDKEDSELSYCYFWVHIVGYPREYVIVGIGRRVVDGFVGASTLQIRDYMRPKLQYFRLCITVLVDRLISQVVMLEISHY